jgi:hypothetical protein
VLASAADATLAPVTAIDGFLLACLVDPATGLTLASAPGPSDLSLSTAAAGAADIAYVLAMLSAKLATDEDLEDVIITFSNHFHIIRPIEQSSGQRVLLLVIADRRRANLAMARREIRRFCATIS